MPPKNCNQGKPCRNTCIARAKTCRVTAGGGGGQRRAARCQRGKKCGRTCINRDKICRNHQIQPGTVAAHTTGNNPAVTFAGWDPNQLPDGSVVFILNNDNTTAAAA